MTGRACPGLISFLMEFEKAIEVVLRHEGGYVNHPQDPGGETNFGITKRSYPDLNIKSLTKADAIEIYRKDFWDKHGIQDYPPSVRLQAFDMIVNMGPKNAVRTIQKCLLRIGIDISPDGVMGPKTMAALRQVSSITLSAELSLERVRYYVSLVEAKPNMKVFLLGWVKRAISVR